MIPEKLPENRLHIRNGGIEQGFLQAAQEDGFLTPEGEKRLALLKSLPQDRTEVKTPERGILQRGSKIKFVD